jgi:hypothetical protein
VKPTPPAAQAVTVLEAKTATPAVKGRVYQPPAIRWEQPFVALAQTSTCTFPGESEMCP